MKAFFKRFMVSVKGFIIGSSMAVPGVSGGTMAIALGIYDRLLSAINGIRKDFKRNAWFLIRFGVAAAIGLFLFYEQIGDLLGNIYCLIPTCALFFGAIIGGLPTLYQKIKPPKLTAKFCVTSLLWGVLGIAIVLGISNITTILKWLQVIDPGVTSLVSTTGSVTLANVCLWIVTGFIISIALILPGISTSHMLLILGITSISELGIWALLIIGISLLVGIFAVTKPLEWAMKRFTHQTYCVILGFVIGSLWAIFTDKETIVPTFDRLLSAALPVWQWVLIVGISVITLLMGVIGLLYLSRFSDD